jgi:hypothetical protein
MIAGLLVLLVAGPATSQTLQSSMSASQGAARKAGRVGSNGSSSPTAPQFCFQPGVGWQKILPEPPVPNSTGTGGSMGQVDSRSVSGAGAQQANADGCGGDSINKRAVGGGVDEAPILSRPQTLRSSGSMKAGTGTSFHGNSRHPAPRAAGTDPAGIASRPTHVASETESDTHPDQVGAHTFHAYTSSIKLRRLIRNAPDFRTRIQLQQLETNPQIHRAGATPKTGGVAAGTMQRERAKRTSSRRSLTHDQPWAIPRKAHSRRLDP